MIKNAGKSSALLSVVFVLQLAVNTVRAETTVSLASTMDPTSHLYDEHPFLFAYYEVGRPWNGSQVEDGAFDATNGFAETGGGIDIWPRETAFQVGSFFYDETSIVGSGIETTMITGLDTSGFWTHDPNGDGINPAGPSVESDLSDYGLSQYFNTDVLITFGGLDANDTVTFTDGVLSSIDLNVLTTMSFYGVDYDGTFGVSGNQLSYQIDDTEQIFGFDGRIVANMTGTVNAISAVPEPSSLAFLGFVGFGYVVTRRRVRAYG
ncbi:PEP-CTERM sorting domain-containing protein [Roseiconus lacunae]|uniref:PEP-CTERM sorting domain-containing protein n=1 Tax=Roseiconus lacunae TaxID=2605694 RepID=UPI00135AFFFE|nr:PEP-CTERM sorting domain-containing protein [Roseiconus lacunae]